MVVGNNWLEKYMGRSYTSACHCSRSLVTGSKETMTWSIMDRGIVCGIELMKSLVRDWQLELKEIGAKKLRRYVNFIVYNISKAKRTREDIKYKSYIDRICLQKIFWKFLLNTSRKRQKWLKILETVLEKTSTSFLIFYWFCLIVENLKPTSFQKNLNKASFI